MNTRIVIKNASKTIPIIITTFFSLSTHVLTIKQEMPVISGHKY